MSDQYVHLYRLKHLRIIFLIDSDSRYRPGTCHIGKYRHHTQLSHAVRRKMRFRNFRAGPWWNTPPPHIVETPVLGGFQTGDDNDNSPDIPPCNIFWLRFFRAVSTVGQLAVLPIPPLFHLRYPLFHLAYEYVLISSFHRLLLIRY